MIRRIITIDETKCNGCGLCARACHEGAIGMADGKARLLREDYCDGLGDCLPACPMNAIAFVEREAPAYNEAAVLAAKKENESQSDGCPGVSSRSIPSGSTSAVADIPGHLRNWPVQIRLAPVNAPYFAGADLLIAADCTAYAFGNFHSEFMSGKITLIGCPKLDTVQYAEKLSQILLANDIRSITVTRMTVPCCGGLTFAVKNALEISGKRITLKIVTISPDGNIVG